MEKGERRRRRRRLEQEGAARQPAAEDAEAEAAISGETADAVQTGAEISETTPAQPQPAAQPAKAAAMAEVIGSGFPQSMKASEGEAASPEVDPFFQRAKPGTESKPAEPARPSAAEARTEAPAAPPPRRDVPPQPQRVAPRTSDPVLRALLVAALVVLAVDTYFVTRLNGLSDRLSAAAAKPTVASTAAPATDRPWIGIGSIKTAPFANGGQPVTTVRFGNSGSEPAYDFRSNTVGSLRPSGSPPPDIPAQKGPVASAGVLVPNAEGILTFFANTRALTADEAARVRSGQLVLWLAGRLDYRDPHGKAHLTTFRYQYNPTLNSFVAAGQGNTAT